MSNDPAVLWYTSDFLTGVTLFTDEQIGQYTKLLCHQHQLGHLPEQHMLNICRSHDNTVFKKFIKDENGLYYNKRMEKEINIRRKYCESRRSNKMKEYEKDKKHNHVLKHMSEHMEDENTNEDVIKDIDTNSLKEGMQGGKPETSDLFIYWLTMPNLAKHKNYTPDMQAAENAALKNYSLEDLKGAIKNLSDILTDPSDYLGVIAWTFEDFFRKGSPQKQSPYKKLLSENNPIESLKRIKPKSEWL